MVTFFLIIIAICAYLLGGINGAIIASKYIYKSDVRKYGSGNAGLTNFYRIFGVTGVALVVAIDVLKSVIAMLIGMGLMSIVHEGRIGMIFAGFCLMLGHVYPVFYQFRGGKGVMCMAVLAYMLDWRIGLIVTAIFFVVLAFTRYVSLCSLTAGLCIPLLTWAFGKGGLEGLLVLFCYFLLVFEHRSNIMRLINHTESKISFGKRPERKLEEDDF